MLYLQQKWIKYLFFVQIQAWLSASETLQNIMVALITMLMIPEPFRDDFKYFVMEMKTWRKNQDGEQNQHSDLINWKIWLNKIRKMFEKFHQNSMVRRKRVAYSLFQNVASKKFNDHHHLVFCVIFATRWYYNKVIWSSRRSILWWWIKMDKFCFIIMHYPIAIELWPKGLDYEINEIPFE